MPALDPILMLILAYFAVFIGGLAYAQMSTQGMAMPRAAH